VTGGLEMIVIDASVAVEILIRTPASVKFAERVINDDVHVPHLIDVEVASAVRRLLQAGAVGVGVAQEAMAGLHDWPIIRHEHTALLPRIWELRDSVSAHDAGYVALAEALKVPLFTLDAKLSRAHGHSAKITLLS